jgi:hypothetical protein
MNSPDDHGERPPDDHGERPPDRESVEERAAAEQAAAARIANQSTWVDLQLRQAIARGDFDELPGYGKPIEGLTGEHDPDWWVRQLVERERITGVLPPSLQLRKEDAELDGRLDRLPDESAVRREVSAFNDRVRWALYRPPEGPPMITPQRDPDTEVDRWRERRQERLEAARRARQAEPSEPRDRRRRRWFRRPR